MKNSDIYDIISGIDEKYRTCSGDFQRIASDFKRSKIRKTEGFISLAASFVLVVFAGLNIYDTNSMIKQSDMLSPVSETISSAEQTLKETFVSKKTTGIFTENTETAVSSLSENKTVNTTVSAENINTASAEKYTVKPESSKVTSKTGITKENILSVPVSEGNVTTAPLPDKNNNTSTEISDENNEGFEDPVLDEIVISNNYRDYTYLSGDRIYSTGMKMMDADSVGEKIEKNIVLRKYSEEENRIYYMTADTYKIKNISDEFAVVVKFPKINTFYLYINLNYKCDTFGQLIDDLDLENNLYIDLMYGYGTSTSDFDRELVKSYLLKNRDAKCTEECYFTSHIMFRANVELLGRNWYGIKIFKSGYLETYIGGTNCKYYYIGEEAAQSLADALNSDFI